MYLGKHDIADCIIGTHTAFIREYYWIFMFYAIITRLTNSWIIHTPYLKLALTQKISIILFKFS